MSREAFTYIDRRTGQAKTDPIVAGAFLDWCYNTPVGRRVTRAVLSRKFVSRIYGWYYRQPWTRCRIEAFASSLGVNLDELTRPLAGFRSIAEFFSRDIDLSKRRIDPEPDACASPADGRLMAYPAVDTGTAFRIKGGLFDVKTLLADEALSRRYGGGSAVVIRLYLSDYHHFHFPDSGIPYEPRAVPGRYFAVSPYARHWAVPFYGENHRQVTLFDSDHFGLIAIVEVGAFTVGSIRQGFSPRRRVAKGDHKGVFELGGSTVVLLFEPSAIQLHEDLCQNTWSGIETFVRLGEAIGRGRRQEDTT